MGLKFSIFCYRQSSIDCIDTADVSELARHLDCSQLRLLDFCSTLELKRLVFQTPELLTFSKTCLNELLPNFIKLLLSADNSIQKARDKLSSIREAISDLDRSTTIRSSTGKKRGRKNTFAVFFRRLRELRFDETPFRELDCNFKKLKTMLAELRQKERKVEARLNSSRWWRKAGEALYTAAIIAVLLGSVVLAVVASPPAAVAGANAVAAAMAPVKEWWRSTWDERKRSLEEEKEAMQMMQSAFVFNLQRELETSVSQIVDKLGSGDDHAGKKKLEKKIAEVETGLAILKERVDACTDEMKKSAASFLKAISK